MAASSGPVLLCRTEKERSALQKERSTRRLTTQAYGVFGSRLTSDCTGTGSAHPDQLFRLVHDTSDSIKCRLPETACQRRNDWQHLKGMNTNGEICVSVGSGLGLYFSSHESWILSTQTLVGCVPSPAGSGADHPFGSPVKRDPHRRHS